MFRFYPIFPILFISHMSVSILELTQLSNSSVRVSRRVTHIISRYSLSTEYVFQNRNCVKSGLMQVVQNLQFHVFWTSSRSTFQLSLTVLLLYQSLPLFRWRFITPLLKLYFQKVLLDFPIHRGPILLWVFHPLGDWISSLSANCFLFMDTFQYHLIHPSLIFHFIRH